MAGFAALKQTVIALRVEQSALIKACFLEAVIHIGGQHEIILILHQCKQPVVEIRGRIHIAVHVDVPAPVGPIFFQRIIMIKASGIHVGKMIVCGKIRKIPVKPFPAVGKSCCRRQPRSGADYNRIRLPYFFLLSLLI